MNWLHDILNKRPRAVAAAALLVLAVVLVMTLRVSADGFGASGGQLDFFTIDDGKTWFTADARKLPPFVHKGKTAYRCRVWTCDDGTTQFVSHLERLSPEAQNAIKSLSDEKARALIELNALRFVEVKPPLAGEDEWTSLSSAKGQALCTPKIPPGLRGEKLRVVLAGQ